MPSIFNEQLIKLQSSATFKASRTVALSRSRTTLWSLFNSAAVVWVSASTGVWWPIVSNNIRMYIRQAC